MKKINFFAILMIAVIAPNTFSQNSATTNASAELLMAMKLTQTSALNFGANILTDATGGTVVLPADNITRSYSGGVAASALAPAASNASYTVSGNVGETYAILLPTSIVVTHLTGATGAGVRTMNITEMTARFNGAAQNTINNSSTLDANGNDSFKVGGKLTIAAGQLGGTYNGTFPISVDYN
jgi:hypothetical protein